MASGEVAAGQKRVSTREHIHTGGDYSRNRSVVVGAQQQRTHAHFGCSSAENGAAHHGADAVSNIAHKGGHF